MKKFKFLTLLFIPIIISGFSFATILWSKNLNLFEKELKTLSNEVARTKLSLKEFEGNLNPNKTKELLKFSEHTLTSAEGMLGQYIDFSNEISNRVKRNNYYILFLSSLNIFIVVLLYRNQKK